MVSGAGLAAGGQRALGFPVLCHLSHQGDQRQIWQSPKHGSLAGVNVLATVSALSTHIL